MAEERATLEAYREKVLGELKIRTERLREIDGELASNLYLQRAKSSDRPLRSGKTLHALAGASRHAKLRREQRELEQKRREAAADVRRAEERLVDVDRELAAIIAGPTGRLGRDEGS